MLSSDSLDQLKKLAAEVSERENCRLYDIEVTGTGKARILRVYVDKHKSQVDADKGSGASIDDCANISRGLSLLLDVEDVVGGGAYELEVSTPGVERVLKEKWHFDSAMGELIRLNANQDLVAPEGLSLKKPLKSLKGHLVEVLEKEIVINVDENKWTVPMASIHKAQVVFEFGHPGTKKPNKKKR